MAFNVEDQSEDSLKCFPTLPRLQYAASEYQPCWFVSVIRRIHQYMKVVIPAEFAMVPPRATCTEEHVQTRHDVKYWMRKPHPLNTKQDWQERLKNIGKKRADDFEKPGNSTMSFAIFDENLYLMGMRDVSEAKILIDSRVSLKDWIVRWSLLLPRLSFGQLHEEAPYQWCGVLPLL